MRITTFLVLGLILLLHSCQSDVKLAQDPTLRLVPATATSVSVLRVPQVLKKADFNDFQQLPIYRELVRDLSGDNAALAHVLDQPQDSGIDWGKNAYLFNEISPANPEAMIQGVLFTLKDAKAFGSFLAKMNQEIEPQTGYQMIRANRQGYLLWNDDTALFGLSMQPSAQTDDFLGQIIRGELESVADNADLQKAFDNEYDISSWASTNAFAEYGDARMMVANLGFDPDALKDNFVHSYANFEDGIMRSHSTFHLQEALTKDLDLLFKDAIQSDLADYLPAKDFQMGFTAALDLEGLNQVLAERVQTRSFINYALQSYDLTLEDLTLAFGGDLYWGNYQGDNTEANSLFVTTINDPERLDKLIQTGTQMGILKETAPGRYQLGPVPVATTSGGIGMAMANLMLAHDKVFITGDAELIDRLAEGKLPANERLPKSFTSRMTDKIFQGIFDFSELPLEGMTDQLPLEKLEVETDRKAMDLQIKTGNPQENSLKHLLWKMNDFYVKSLEEGDAI